MSIPKNMFQVLADLDEDTIDTERTAIYTVHLCFQGNLRESEAGFRALVGVPSSRSSFLATRCLFFHHSVKFVLMGRRPRDNHPWTTRQEVPISLLESIKGAILGFFGGIAGAQAR